MWVFLFQKYGKFYSISLGHFIKHKPLISGESGIFYYYSITTLFFSSSNNNDTCPYKHKNNKPDKEISALTKNFMLNS